ncbi:MAG TPA: hypothetical protein VL983_05135 [Terriglobales bacterium]|nr:hypothetical protein [Terriglobales bacterium]
MNQSATLSRAGMGLVVVGYAGVFAVSAALIARRYLAGLRDPDMFSGGMGAGGDWFLELFLVALFLIPTFLLALLIRNSETAYTKLAQILLGFAIAAPICVALMAIPAIGQTNKFPGSFIGSICLYRVFAFPMTLVGLAGCCVLAKFKRPRRLLVYSLGVEIGTAVLLFSVLTMAK